MLPPGARVNGEASLALEAATKKLTALSEQDWREVRGGGIAMVFQEPMTSLNPVMHIGAQVEEAIRAHQPELKSGDVKRKALDSLKLAAVPEPEARAEQFPHQLSGGLRQRAMIGTARTAAILSRVGLSEDAMHRYPKEFSGGQRQRIGIARALTLQPKLIVADEPVSALDVSVGAQVLLLLQELQREFALAYVFISRSLPVVVQVATRIAVMRAGQFLEVGAAERVLHQPQHDYTRELLAAVPELPRA